MRISRDEALAMASAKKKLLTVRKGQGWLLCPYMPGAAYHSVHWLSEDRQSVQCEGEVDCPHHHRPLNRKVHVPCLVLKRPYRADSVGGLRFVQDLYHNSDWTPKIVELTGNCFKPLEEPSRPDQLGIAWRPGDKQNGTLYFKWIDAILRDVPAELAELTVAKILPGVIGGRYRDYEERSLDNSLEGRIKHNSNSRNDCNGSDDFDGVPPPLFGVPNGSQHRKAGG